MNALRAFRRRYLVGPVAHHTSAELLGGKESLCDDLAIMMLRARKDPELRRRARKKAYDLGISLAEYIRQLVRRDLETPQRTVDPSVIFDLGDSGGSDIARDRDRMVGKAISSRYAPFDEERRY